MVKVRIPIIVITLLTVLGCTSIAPASKPIRIAHWGVTYYDDGSVYKPIQIFPELRVIYKSRDKKRNKNLKQKRRI